MIRLRRTGGLVVDSPQERGVPQPLVIASHSPNAVRGRRSNLPSPRLPRRLRLLAKTGWERLGGQGVEECLESASADLTRRLRQSRSIDSPVCFDLSQSEYQGSTAFLPRLPVHESQVLRASFNAWAKPAGLSNIMKCPARGTIKTRIPCSASSLGSGASGKTEARSRGTERSP